MALVDSANAPVGSFLFFSTVLAPVAHYAAVPVGGHPVMPSDGETFMVHFAQVYS